MKVLLRFDPTKEDLEVMKTQWPSEIETIEMGPSGISDLGESINDIVAIVGSMKGANLELIQAAKNLRVIHTLGHGVDAILKGDNRAELIKREIAVGRTNPAGISISEFTIMNMIAISRRLISIHNSLVNDGDWSEQLKADRSTGCIGGELNDSTLGLIGYGNIAQQIAHRARAFNMNVGALIRRPRSIPELDFQETDLKTFLAKSDYVVIMAPLTSMTRNLINAESIGWMKDGAYLLNMSRGPIIDEGAVHAALKSGKLSGVALDVFEVEEKGGKMKGYPSQYDFSGLNIVFTPHLCGATKESRVRALTIVGANLKRLVNGEPLKNLVDLHNDEY